MKPKIKFKTKGNLSEALMQEAKRSIKKDFETEISCPSCDEIIKVKVGNNTCPYCNKTIDFKLEI